MKKKNKFNTIPFCELLFNENTRQNENITRFVYGHPLTIIGWSLSSIQVGCGKAAAEGHWLLHI